MTSRVSVASDGTEANGNSRAPVLSADGRFIAFLSQATNLVPGDTNAVADVFVRDTVAGTPIIQVSSAVTTTGAQVETINPGPPIKLAFTTPPQTITVGACSGIATVQVRDGA